MKLSGLLMQGSWSMNEMQSDIEQLEARIQMFENKMLELRIEYNSHVRDCSKQWHTLSTSVVEIKRDIRIAVIALIGALFSLVGYMFLTYMVPTP